jgi:hypothetical protein
VRCSGLPEKRTFDRVPPGLSRSRCSASTRAIRRRDLHHPADYLAWGFDWQAHYVATLDEAGRDDAMTMRLMSWLTLLNDNGQSFEGRRAAGGAGTLNVVSNFQSLADPPDARAAQPDLLSVRQHCRGHAGRGPAAAASAPATAATTPAASAPAMMAQDAVVVTGARSAMKAAEEALGDLKLYRVPERVTVAAKGLKQVAFLDQDEVQARMLYRTPCAPWDARDEAQAAAMLLVTVNDKAHGLGMALPMGG